MLDVATQCSIIVEGIYDFYALELFRAGRNISIIPSVGADSVRFYVSLCIAWHVTYKAVWDNDEMGRKEMKRAEDVFGALEATDRFFLLPSAAGKNRILQDLFAGDDLASIRHELDLAKTASFEKTIAALHFSPDRSRLAGNISKTTRRNFEELYSH